MFNYYNVVFDGDKSSGIDLRTELPDPKDKHYPQNTTSGRFYASSAGALNGAGRRDISTYLKTDVNGTWQSLGRPLNSPGNEGDFYIARDESFIVFGSPHRGGATRVDVYWVRFDSLLETLRKSGMK